MICHSSPAGAGTTILVLICTPDPTLLEYCNSGGQPVKPSTSAFAGVCNVRVPVTPRGLSLSTFRSGETTDTLEHIVVVAPGGIPLEFWSPSRGKTHSQPT